MYTYSVSPRGPCNKIEDSVAWMRGILCCLEPGSKPKMSYAVLYSSENDQKSSTASNPEDGTWQMAGIITLLPTNFSVLADGTTSSEPPTSGGCKAMELGYIFLPQAWGRGYATESCEAMMKVYKDLTVAHTWLPRELCASVHKLNGKSIRVVEKLGFERAAEFKAEGNLPLVEGKKEYDVVHLKRDA